MPETFDRPLPLTVSPDRLDVRIWIPSPALGYVNLEVRGTTRTLGTWALLDAYEGLSQRELHDVISAEMTAGLFRARAWWA